jgi:hypothetical protein
LVDVDKLRKAVKTFSYQAGVISANRDDEAKVDDIDNLISEIEKLMKIFIDELAKDN